MAEKSKHILFVASWYPTQESPALGNFIQQHARAASIENRVSVVYAQGSKKVAQDSIETTENHSGKLFEFIIKFGKVTSRLPIYSHLKKRNAYRNAIRTGIEMAQYKNGKFDLLHVHVIWPAAIALVPLMKKLNLPLIISEHWSGYLPEDGNYGSPLMKRFSRLLTAKAKQITVVSKRMEEAMKSHGLGRDFSILPNAVDTSIFNLECKKASQDSFQLLHVSMLVDREKNISGLLHVMNELKDHSDIKLNIVGEGPERIMHEAHAKQLGLLNSTVFFLGYKSPKEASAEMKKSNALLMFSNFEGMPVTIIEAQCCGLPILATKVGSIPNMVNTTQGILVDVTDEKQLVNAILRMKESQSNFDPVKISAEAIANYGLVAVGKELNHLYQSILK